MTRGRSVSRKRSIRGKSNHGPFFDNRADIIWKVLARDRFVSIGILPSVNFTQQNRAVKPGISVCSRIIRLMNNRTKKPKKAAIPTEEEKATTKMLWLLWKLYHNCVVPHTTRNILKEANSPRETRCTKSWDQFEKYDSHCLRYVKQVCGKRKDHRLKKYKSKNPHPRSPCAVKFEERSHEET